MTLRTSQHQTRFQARFRVENGVRVGLGLRPWLLLGLELGLETWLIIVGLIMRG